MPLARVHAPPHGLPAVTPLARKLSIAAQKPHSSIPLLPLADRAGLRDAAKKRLLNPSETPSA